MKAKKGQLLWRPIKTAPKDGTKVLIFADGHQFAAWWDAKFDLEWSGSGRMKYTGAWTDNAVLSFGYEETQSYKPTHWMPLPPQP